MDIEVYKGLNEDEWANDGLRGGTWMLRDEKDKGMQGKKGEVSKGRIKMVRKEAGEEWEGLERRGEEGKNEDG